MDDPRETISEFLTRVGKFDAEGASHLFADEIEWDAPTPRELPWGGHRTRAADVADYFKTMWSFFEIEKSVVRVDQLMIEGMDGVALGVFNHIAKTLTKPLRQRFPCT